MAVNLRNRPRRLMCGRMDDAAPMLDQPECSLKRVGDIQVVEEL